MIRLTRIVCVVKALQYIAYFFHCCPNTIKNTYVSHTVALDDMFLYYYKHGH